MSGAISSIASASPSRPGASAAETGAGAARSAPTGATAAPGGLKSSPAVINAVKVPAGSGVFGTTQADIQTAVNGINAGITAFLQRDWSKMERDLTPDQIAKAKQYDVSRILGAEGATIALAGESGVTGVSFNYEKINPASSPAAAPSPAASPTSSANQPLTAATASSSAASGPVATSAAPALPSAANIALTVLGGSSSQDASAPGRTQDFDFTA